MKHANPLNTLIEQSRQARDKAGKQLAGDRDSERQAGEQLDALRQYKSEYQAKLSQAMAAGVDSITLDNYYRFIMSLETAIGQAGEQLDESRHRVDDSKNLWRVQQRKLSSYDTLAQRRAANLHEREQRQEQRRSDEVNTTTQARKQCAQDSSHSNQGSSW